MPENLIWMQVQRTMLDAVLDATIGGAMKSVMSTDRTISGHEDLCDVVAKGTGAVTAIVTTADGQLVLARTYHLRGKGTTERLGTATPEELSSAHLPITITVTCGGDTHVVRTVGKAA